MPLSPLEANKVDEWEQMVDVNIKGVLYGIAAALPRFQTQKSGHLLKIHRWRGMSYFLMGRCIANQISPCGPSRGFRQESGSTIRTTIIPPGAVKSELSGHITDVGTAETIKPLKEIAIEADAIARAVAFHRATGRRGCQ
jgi:NADP-dependent 3-hydroxy acid dehydrogenase YdfG